MRQHHNESYQIYIKAKNMEEAALGLYHAAMRGEDLDWDTKHLLEQFDHLTLAVDTFMKMNSKQ